MESNSDILFINPPYERIKGLAQGGFSYGILSIATYLKSKGFIAYVYDADASQNDGIKAYNNKNRAESQDDYAKCVDSDDHYIWQEVKTIIKRYSPKFVGVTVMTPSIHSAMKVMKIAKELDKIVLMGGPHLNILKDKALNMEYYDYAFFGEGEYSIESFLNNYHHKEEVDKIKGIGYFNRDKNIYHSTGFSPRITDLNDLPFPNRELLVYPERFLKTDLSTIMASRGCPYRCDFCASVPIWGRKTVFRSPENLIKEIEHLTKKYQVREFRFFDDTFTAFKKNVIKFCKLLIDKFGERKLRWWCLCRVNTIDEEVIYWLKKSGCDQVKIGVESGSQRILDKMHKDIKLETVEKAVKLLKKNNFWVHTFFMVGIPYETVSDIRSTINFIKKIKPDSINLCTFTPYPGTQLYEYSVNKGIVKEGVDFEIFKRISHHSTNNYFMENVSAEEYKDLLSEILEETTKITEKLTTRKVLYKIKNLTFGKITRKVKLKYKIVQHKLSMKHNTL